MKKDYKVLGLDPSLNATGWAVLQIKNGKEELLEAGTVRPDYKINWISKARYTFLQLLEIQKEFSPDLMIIEHMPISPNNVALARIGTIVGCCIASSGPNTEIKTIVPSSVKKQITGSGKSTKQEVRNFVKSLGFPKIMHKDLDASDALAAALCYKSYEEFWKIK